jgi:hypothetical protein
MDNVYQFYRVKADHGDWPMSDIPLFTPAQALRRVGGASSFNPTAFLPHAALVLSVGFVAGVLCGLI